MVERKRKIVDRRRGEQEEKGRWQGCKGGEVKKNKSKKWVCGEEEKENGEEGKIKR